MRILYLNLSLPDHRVEKAAYIAKKNGHTIFYAGDIKKNYKPSKVFGSELFKEYFKIPFTAKNNLGFNLKPLIKKLKEIQKEFDFDIIHANNIYCANLASKLDIPFVFDDHEYFSHRLQYMKFPVLNYKDYFANIIMKQRYPKWESNFSKNYPVISVSKGIVEDYKKRMPNGNFFLVPNMPLLEEVNAYNYFNKEKVKDKLTTIYVGLNDFSSNTTPYRDTTGLIELWEDGNIGELIVIGDRHLKSSTNVNSMGFVSQEEVFRELGKANIGIISWIPHPFHKFCNPNKIYNYIHFGLYPIYPKTLDTACEVAEIISKESGNEFGFSFMNFKEIQTFLSKNKSEIQNYDIDSARKIAKKHFVLDKYTANLLNAYNLALELQT